MDHENEAVAVLNDAFRQDMGATHKGMVVFTTGVQALSSNERMDAYEAVRTFEEFTEDNDPQGEHDFGSFEIEGTKLFWKIDYYADESLQYGAEDPEHCYRVLTVMLASEY